jgi:hypothetical protein
MSGRVWQSGAGCGVCLAALQGHVGEQPLGWEVWGAAMPWEAPLQVRLRGCCVTALLDWRINH